jgi:hypothetical protein
MALVMTKNLTKQALRGRGSCARCSKRLPKGQLLEDSILFTNAGVPESLVCGSCLTVEELADAVILEVTRDVAVSRDGRIWNRPTYSMKMTTEGLSE